MSNKIEKLLKVKKDSTNNQGVVDFREPSIIVWLNESPLVTGLIDCVRLGN